MKNDLLNHFYATFSVTQNKVNKPKMLNKIKTHYTCRVLPAHITKCSLKWLGSYFHYKQQVWLKVIQRVKLGRLHQSVFPCSRRAFETPAWHISTSAEKYDMDRFQEQLQPAERGYLMFGSTKQSLINKPILFAICNFVFKHKPTIISSDKRPKASPAEITVRFVRFVLNTELLRAVPAFCCLGHSKLNISPHNQVTRLRATKGSSLAVERRAEGT